MAAKIKLQRIGTKNKPFYRVVIQDESATPSSNVVEVLGQYDSGKEPSLFNVNKEKTLAWIKKGAKPTDRVRILLGKAGILPPVDLAALPKRKKKGEAPVAETAAPAEAGPVAPKEQAQA
ncbi:30S ribosomal protein S16 [candidate division WOR-1 bacterium RIFCSPHIGHO2_01_FULL_53_15]|uniref:Small ribosomal subunit protein bS16 n=1 Tax=candidate division WOR-1 bacterium RIFCSPHIGHO2_01_FULL_53_15 TaxID=1802564 RepID=A0A1F4PZX8_UNCSA|nr:MAG: 30S ribosomal protein S16 [candidate division WOR-1 bacterium RIFCSPHIGHO2_01_FULL_53_15]OGC12876.1 MAG: 30S ribosomal protein S16 [candidate division WOR-1 bacterium RIFCSPHIGHO2_02_FULL_53_26]